MSRQNPTNRDASRYDLSPQQEAAVDLLAHRSPRWKKHKVRYAVMRGTAFKTALFLVVVGLIVSGAFRVLAAVEFRVISEQSQKQLNPQLSPFQTAVIAVDSKGNEVGPYFPGNIDNMIFSYFVPSLVLRKVNGVSLVFAVSNNGFVSTGVDLYYTSTNCTGTAYLPENSEALAVVVGGGALFLPVQSFSPPSNGGSWAAGAGVVGGMLYYALPGPSPTMLLNSDQLINPDGTKACSSHKYAPLMGTVRPITTLKLSTLGLVPPFHLNW